MGGLLRIEELQWARFVKDDQGVRDGVYQVEEQVIVCSMWRCWLLCIPGGGAGIGVYQAEMQVMVYTRWKCS